MIIIEAEASELDLATSGRECCREWQCDSGTAGCELEDSWFIENFCHLREEIDVVHRAVGTDVARLILGRDLHTGLMEAERTVGAFHWDG